MWRSTSDHVDQLLAADDWKLPTEVLDPEDYLDYASMVRLAQARVATMTAMSTDLRHLIEKLEPFVKTQEK